MKKNLLSVLLMFTAIGLFAQARDGGLDIIEVDTVFQSPTKPLPFDKEFILKIHFDHLIDVEGYALLEIPKRLVDNYKEETEALGVNIMKDRHVVVSAADKKSCSLFLLVPPLNPGKFYDFKIIYRIDSVQSEKYLAVLAELVKLDDPKQDKAAVESKILQLIKDINEAKDMSGDDTPYRLWDIEKLAYAKKKLTAEAISLSLLNGDGKPELPESKAEKRKRVKAEKKSEKNIYSDFEEEEDKTNQRNRHPYRKYMTTVVKKDLAKRSQAKKLPKGFKSLQQVNVEDPSQFIAFYRKNKELIKKYLQMKALADKEYDIPDELVQSICNNKDENMKVALKKMLKDRLDASCNPAWKAIECAKDTAKCREVNLLEKCCCTIDTCKLITAAYDGGYCKSKSEYEDAVKKFKATRLELVSGLKKDFIAMMSLRNSSTMIFDAQTRSKFAITPDFGWVGYGFQPGFNGVTGYAGVQIEFRYTDKNIPFWFLRKKTAAHFFSFTMGLTYLPLTQKNKRVDLINGKSSLLLGVGFRVSSLVRITAGGILFYKLNPNPVVSTKNLAFTPFLGVSLDISLRELFGEIANIKGLIQDIRGIARPSVKQTLQNVAN